MGNDAYFYRNGDSLLAISSGKYYSPKHVSCAQLVGRTTVVQWDCFISNAGHFPDSHVCCIWHLLHA
jgi:hypothetical protein